MNFACPNHSDRSCHVVSTTSFLSQLTPQCHDVIRQPPVAKNGKSLDVVSSRARRNAAMCASKVGKRMFGCPLCRYATDRKNNLKRHLSTMHRECATESLAISTRQHLDCCRLPFRNKVDLRNNGVGGRQGGEDEGYTCDKCDRKELYKRHLAADDEPGYHVKLQSETHPLQLRKHLVSDCSDVMAAERILQNGAAGHCGQTRGCFDNLLEKILMYAGKFPINASSSMSSLSSLSSQSSGLNADVATVIDEKLTDDSSVDRATTVSCCDIVSVENQVRFQPRPSLAYKKPSSRMFFYNRISSTHADVQRDANSRDCDIGIEDQVDGTNEGMST